MESAGLGAQWNINPEAGWTGKIFVALKYILFIKGRRSEIWITKGKGVFRCSAPYKLWGWRCATNITRRCRLAIWTMSTNNIVKRFLSPLRCDRNDQREESHSLIIWANRCHLWRICEHHNTAYSTPSALWNYRNLASTGSTGGYSYWSPADLA